MKCLSCDKVLTDFEATRKYAGSNTFVDLCNKCFKEADIPEIVERYDLKTTEDIEEDDLADITDTWLFELFEVET